MTHPNMPSAAAVDPAVIALQPPAGAHFAQPVPRETLAAQIRTGGYAVLGAPALGWIADHFGARWTLIGGGALTSLGTIAAALTIGRWQGVRVRTLRSGLVTSRTG